jgi:iron complex outermembrane receptor protein
VFGAYTFPVSSAFRVQLGISLNDTRFDFRDLANEGDENTSAERAFDPILLPSIGLEYVLSHGRLYGNISRGFSNPGLEEALTPDGALNPGIEQEKGVNYELGYKGRALRNRLAISVALYQMNINDLLVAERFSEDQFIGRNAGSSRHRGAEVDMKYLLPLGGNWVIRPRLGYSYSDHQFLNFVDEEEDFSGNPLAGVPVHRINSGLLLSYATKWTLAINHQFVDQIPLNDANTLFSEAFHVVGFLARCRTTLSEHFRLGVHAGVNNLFNTNYAQSVLINAVGFGGAEPRYFYPGNNRNYFGGLSVSYRF